MTKKELEGKVAQLEERIQKLEVRPPEVHYHTHYAPVAPATLPMPTVTWGVYTPVGGSVGLRTSTVIQPFPHSTILPFKIEA